MLNSNFAHLEYQKRQSNDNKPTHIVSNVYVITESPLAHCRIKLEFPAMANQLI